MKLASIVLRAFLSALLAFTVAIAPMTRTHAASPAQIGMATGNTLLFMNDAQIEQRMADMQSLGVTWIRVDFNWSLIQYKGYSSFDFSYHDRILAAASRHNINILAMLAYTPVWARTDACKALVIGEAAQQKCTPRDTKEFARFAKTTAAYFAPKGIHAWEIWNEPNLKPYWAWVGPSGGLEINPEAFGRMANAAGKAIHEAQPDAVVIAGGLAPAYDPNNPRSMRPGDYLRRLAPVLDTTAVNAVAMHPYTQPALPREHYDWNAFYTVDGGSSAYNLRQILVNAGKGSMPIWGTEFGASTVGVLDMCTSVEDRKIAGKVFDHVSEGMQATIISQGIEDWFVKQNVGPLFIHADSDQWLQNRTNENGYGLRRSDGTKKPSYDVIAPALTAAKNLSGN